MNKNGQTGGTRQQLQQNWIAFIGKQESLKVPYADVLFIEQSGNTLFIQRDLEPVEITGRVSEISKVLREPFCMCHSYLIVNIDRIQVMTKGKIVFDNQSEKYLGRDSYAKTRKKFNKYLLGDYQF